MSAADSATNANNSVQTASFEETFIRLRSIVEELETGDLTLDETIERYREGTRLAAHCQALIQDAELRITELSDVANAPEDDDND